MEPKYLLLTCEHATNRIPPEYRKLFRGREKILESHRGWDRGAVEIARALEREFGFPLHEGKHCRLLADLNRSRECGEIFSEFTKQLSPLEQERILRRYHDPHWERARKTLRRECRAGLALHLGIHSFTPILRGKKRKTGIGLLCDPSRAWEYAFCKALQRKLRTLTTIEVHLNSPYKGAGDGLAHSMRGEFPEKRFAGIEIEVNQKYLKTHAGIRRISNLFRESLAGMVPTRN